MPRDIRTKIINVNITRKCDNYITGIGGIHNEQTGKIQKLESIKNVFIIVGIIFLCIGFFKALVYNNPEYGDSINAYVGGDAYNYIVNASYFAAYSILGMGSLIIATICGVGAVLMSVEDNVTKQGEKIIEDIENNLPEM